MQQYKELLDRVMSHGSDFKDRSGVGSVCLFGESIVMNLQDGFPIVTLRKINYQAAIGELAAFIAGATTNEEFQKFGCNYWSEYGSQLGPIYGYQWRNWGGDQLRKLVQNIKQNPFSRRHILSTWNAEDLDAMVLPPCHLLAQYHVTENRMLDSVVYMRSVDLAVGLPYDIIVYALLQHLIAYECGLTPRYLRFFFGNAHIYKPHLENVSIMMDREPKQQPILYLDPIASLLNFDPADAEVHDYTSHGPIKFELFK